MPSADFDSGEGYDANADEGPTTAGELENPWPTATISMPSIRVKPESTGDIQPMPLTGVVPPHEVGEHSPLILDPRFALERALIDMVEVSRRKRADYATDDDEFSNLRGPAHFAGFEGAFMTALFTVEQKLERIRSLRANGRLSDPQNEAVLDTLRDIAVWGTLALAVYLQDAKTEHDQGEDRA